MFWPTCTCTTSSQVLEVAQANQMHRVFSLLNLISDAIAWISEIVVQHAVKQGCASMHNACLCTALGVAPNVCEQPQHCPE